MATVQNELDFDFARSPADKMLFLKHIQSELNEIRQEVAEVNTSDDEIDPIPVSAYDEAALLLEAFFDQGVPMPHIGWAEDGSLGFEWRPEGGIATMGIYGDNLVIYGVFFEKNRQVDGVCPLSDTALLGNFLETLRQLL
ncbi:MAG: hypothetical protein OXU23_26815 [Candidatus Poribacteria bacterium]|nr:hypothetical protein [Candidatus Poribacteria bacterium]